MNRERRFLVPLKTASELPALGTPEVRWLASYYKYGTAWASAATEEVFSLVSTHQSLAITQTLLCLMLYRFARGETDQAGLNTCKPP